MKKVILPIVLILLSSFAISQDSTDTKRRIYKAKITTDNMGDIKGYLASVSDSSMHISSSYTRFNDNIADIENYTAVNYSSVEKVRLKRKGAGLRGAIKGAIVGLSIGVISGYAAGDDPPCERPQPGSDFLASEL